MQRRKRGENEYFTALKADLLPRATRGPMAKMTRLEQKVSLAQLLFSEDEDCEDKGPSEVYVDQVKGDEDEKTLKHREDRVAQAKAALRLSLLLREPACASLSLAELCKRTLTHRGREGAKDALRCADLAIEIAGSGFWDSDEVAVEVSTTFYELRQVTTLVCPRFFSNGTRKTTLFLRGIDCMLFAQFTSFASTTLSLLFHLQHPQAEDNPVHDPKYEKNATSPGLAHPQTLKLLPIRVSHLCLRSALLQRGNALAALGKEVEARECYSSIFPILTNEPRCARVDWERHSVYVNVGNTYAREGDFDKADEQYKVAEALGNDHINEKGGSEEDGRSMILCAKRSRAFALKKVGKEAEAKALLKEVIAQKLADDAAAAKKKQEEEEAAKLNEQAITPEAPAVEA